jgi:ubiquinol-cytochrome c reductase cytochrome b subunit
MPYMISWITVALFNVSIFSGLVVAFVYKPSLAYESVQKLTFLVPYGDIFRELHYFSSETFLMMTLIHVVLELRKKEINISANSWNYSLLALGALFFVMFTGYVLKADLSGLSAGEVAISLLKQTPGLNFFLPLFEDSSLFVWKFYLWHILFLPIILVYALLLHVKTFKTKQWSIGLGMSVLCMIFFTMPRDISPDTMGVHVTGPWFFKGAENLLMFGIHPVVVDIVMFFPFALLVCYFYKSFWRTGIRVALILWSVAYAIFSFI